MLQAQLPLVIFVFMSYIFNSFTNNTFVVLSMFMFVTVEGTKTFLFVKMSFLALYSRVISSCTRPLISFTVMIAEGLSNFKQLSFNDHICTNPE